MKVILNEDIKNLGEEGDVKNVANGYARNFLFPRNLAVPYNEYTVAIFEEKKAEIEARKEVKRQNSASMKEKLETLNLVAEMPAGVNGKLYGAVTAQTILDLLNKEGFNSIERKKIEIPGVSIKSTGSYKFTIKLYEAQIAEMEIEVKAQTKDGETAPVKKNEVVEPEQPAQEDAETEEE